MLAPKKAKYRKQFRNKIQSGRIWLSDHMGLKVWNRHGLRQDKLRQPGAQ